ncbi:MAG: hypothetical protein U9Q30_01135 [Campylobacterota bacterium]|nr:hypothetical protein [Campylobacterota bacterium]
MYKNTFDKELANNVIYNAYMFYGQENYLIETYGNNIAKILAGEEDISRVYFDDYNYKESLNFLSQYPMFSSKNVLLIKTVKKIDPKEIEKLIYVCNENPNSFVIFCCLEDLNFRSMAKQFKKENNSVDVRFFIPKEYEANELIFKKAQELLIDINKKELQYLYTMHQKDLSLVINDLEKLSILQEKITLNIINNQCFGMGNVILNDFLYNLFSGRIINKDLYMILKEGLDEVVLIREVLSYIQELFMINSYLTLNNNKLNIIEIWGYNLPKDIANQKSTLSSKFTQEDFFNMLELFQNLELELKTKANLDINSYTQAVFRKFSATLR